MKKLLILIFCLSIWSCEDEVTTNFNPIDIKSCFSPELGTTESEQFFYNAVFGELVVDITGNITTNNPGYSIEEGSKTVFIYRHILENSFNIDDDEVELRILFQIDNNLDKFDISNSEDFEKSNCIYGECGIALQSITGNINGNKDSDGNWSVNADLMVDRFTKTKAILFDEDFKF